MKKVWLIILSLFLNACSAIYVEPTLIGNEAVLKINNDEPFEFNAPFGMLVEVKLDGKLIHNTNFPDLTARISPGRHTMSVSVSAYYFNRAKHYSTENYELEFKENDLILITPKVSIKELESRTDDVEAELNIIGSEVNISTTFTLKDSPLRSMGCEAPCFILIPI
ncbi:hypothetical protein OAP18_01315 [Gammaproteobacteria bacterium]|nr:hypothetical protein [Gammaproteobacteria bacterium]